MRTLTLNNMGTLPYGAEEALNRLRVNFGFCGKEYKKVIITSSTPDEGKSFVAAQLWRMLAEAGNKVVLVDADLRKSVIRSRYQISGEDERGARYGLAYYLAGQAELEDTIYATNIENGFMVPTFQTVSNPAILLQNDRFSVMLEQLAKVFDYVLVDTPPLSNVSDGELIASLCDGALLVIRSGVTPRSLVASSIQQLEHANCKLMGTVLNRVEKEQSAYYYKYAKYGYGYGGEEPPKKKSRREDGETSSKPAKPAPSGKAAKAGKASKPAKH